MFAETPTSESVVLFVEYWESARDNMAVVGSQEPLSSWRRICFVLMGILAIMFLYSASHAVQTPSFSLQHPPPPSYHAQALSYDFGNASVDNELIDGLTSEECSYYFPDLYQEIDRGIAYWKDKEHTITEADVALKPDQKGSMRIMIHDNRMRILQSIEALFLNFRALGVLSLFQRALDSATLAGERLPTIEVHISYYDDPVPDESGTTSMWSTARNVLKESHNRNWLIPNFDFWYSPPSGSFEEAKKLAMQYDNTSFAEKIQKIVWRGNPRFNELRRGLIKTAGGKEWADVRGIEGSEDEEWKLEEFQYCRYAMTIYTEGVSFSGRLKFLMNCPSLLFVPEREWTVHYDHLLIPSGPSQNHIAVKRDWSDLEEKVRHYLMNPKEADRIIKNMLETFRSRYTTRAATSCYIRRLIQGFASVSERPEVMYGLYGGEVQGMRGISWERFMMLPMDGDFDFKGNVGET